MKFLRRLPVSLCASLPDNGSHANIFSLQLLGNQNQPPRPPREQNLEDLFRNKVTVTDTKKKMTLLNHQYVWREGVRREQGGVPQAAGPRYKRLSVDFLLPGPTNETQVECEVIQPARKKLRVKYTPPATFLSARRTAIRLAHAGGVADGQLDAAATRTAGMARVTAHEDTLEAMTEDEKKLTFEVDLPFQVEPFFTTRDDWGNEGMMEGVQICVYAHEDPNFQAANQVVWIMHVEMVGSERAPVAAARPGAGFGIFNAHA